MMSWLALAVVVLSHPAGDAADYRDPVDITVPVDGVFTDDYHAGRAGGRIHRATDIFEEQGTGVHAAMGGTVTWAPTEEHATAGFALQIAGDDGRRYAYYHLGPAGGTRADALADGIDEGVRVERGQLVGYLGNSGNAVHTPPHLHFEIHDPWVSDPYGTDRVNPYASLRAAGERGDVPAHDPAPAPHGHGEHSEHGEYEVRPGDTLSGIAHDHDVGHWRRLHEANPDIRNPHLIYPGDRVQLPAPSG